MGTEQDFFGKIDWEGGVQEALDYGLTVDKYELSQPVKERWNNLVAAYALVGPLIRDFETDYLV